MWWITKTFPRTSGWAGPIMTTSVMERCLRDGEIKCPMPDANGGAGRSSEVKNKRWGAIVYWFVLRACLLLNTSYSICCSVWNFFGIRRPSSDLYPVLYLELHTAFHFYQFYYNYLINPSLMDSYFNSAGIHKDNKIYVSLYTVSCMACRRICKKGD